MNIPSKKEFKLMLSSRMVSIGTWVSINKKEYDKDPDTAWKELREHLIIGKKSRFKNFRDGEKTLEDYNKALGVKKEGSEYFMGLKLNCQYKDYKSFLLEKKDKMILEIYEIDKVLGIKSIIK